ncbi:zinc finger MYM-type protein 1-like [Haliotis rubra]|uniref:zinc finger MYM-type protein 1-like n=1 Tax=Haliotis rubra TaxID=36100 RepID=UPI001EE52DCE|nr:zinc finger MYM-type protein 1-like [Haliotis rubra]
MAGTTPQVQSKKESQSETKPSEFLRPQDSQSHINPVPDIISESKSKDVSMESSLTSELQSSPGSDEDERQHVLAYGKDSDLQKHPTSRQPEATFISEGFNNWKKSGDEFKKHDKSSYHRDALAKHKKHGNDSVTSLLLAKVTKEQQCRRNLRGSDIEGLPTWLSEKTYMSPAIVNEQSMLLGRAVRLKILERIKAASVHEDAIGLYEVPSTTSATLTEVLKDTLIRCDLPLSNCRGQGYDGASNFQDHVNGVAVQLQGEEPRAVHVHCLAHCINLALQEATRACKPLRDALDITIEVNKLIKYSPKREHLFKNLPKALSIEKRLDMDVPQTERTRGLRPLCPTRWTVRTGSINSVLENFDTLRKAFEEINKGHDENARIAGGLLSQFDQFSVPFGLKVSSQIFGASEQLSSSIQSVETTAKDARKGAEQVLAYYDKLRSTDTFSEFYKSVVDEAEDKTDPPRLPRYRKRPKRLDDGSNTHTFPSVEDYCRQQYFEGLDIVSEQLKRRFSQKGFETAVEIEQLLLSAANGRNFQISSHIRELYKDDVDFVRLNTQLSMLHDTVKSVSTERGCLITEVTNIDTVVSIINSSPVIRHLFKEISTLLKIYLTIPVTTATSERTFSTLRRLKSYVRSTMTQERLNNVLLLHVHKTIADELSLVDVAREFISFHDRRRNYFGLFS